MYSTEAAYQLTNDDVLPSHRYFAAPRFDMGLRHTFGSLMLLDASETRLDL